MQSQYHQLELRNIGKPLELVARSWEKNPGPGEMEVEIHYSGVNFADLMMARGLYPDAPRRPFVPGYEMSGIVSKLGEGVSEFAIGDQVYGGCFFGGYSSKAVLPCNQVYKVPEYLTLEQAAGLPVAAITCYNALIEMGRIRKGDKALIDCATGGVGTIALQILRHFEVETIGLTSSAEKKAYIEQLGAKAMTHEEFKHSNENNFDFILNSQGGSSIKLHYKRLGQCGRVVCIGASSSVSKFKYNYFKAILTLAQTPKLSVLKMFDHNKGVFAFNALRLMQDEQSMQKLPEQFKQIEQMGLTPQIGAVRSFKQLNQAYSDLLSRQISGKLVINWAN